MKNKFIKIMVLVFSLACFVSCSEENPIPSEITYFPTFELEGGQYLLVQKGVAYTDTGVKALAGDSELPLTTTGTVNTDQVGLYRLDYSATNVDGFDGTSFRYVIVADDPAAIASADLSGSYTRDTNAAHVMTLTKVADGFYQADDILPTNKINALIAHVSGTEVVIPRQSSRFGDIVADPTDVAGSNGDLVGGKDISLNTFIACCGIFSRNFIKD
ncbi:immunoglobulin-like domain-containing protein [Algibacter sp. PT7-4]|uniref:immunoglobulin-like domain-containing protein n=1 Tax=Algibacter ulvanivorans TaxID=3400999 RepID=UPI003AAA3695